LGDCVICCQLEKSGALKGTILKKQQICRILESGGLTAGTEGLNKKISKKFLRK